MAALVTPLAAVSGPASAAPTTATYQAKGGTATRLEQASGPSGLKSRISSFSAKGPRSLTHLEAKGSMSLVGQSHATTGIGGYTFGGPTPTLENFNGLSDIDQANVNGGEGIADVTPPDQGLCIGYDPLLSGDPKVVFEIINSAVRETTMNGTPLRPDISLATLFDDPFAQGDPRCEWDASAHTFFFTEIGYPATGPQPQLPLPLNTTAEVAVWNAHGVADYAFDTSLGDTCFGDQPKTGYDNNALLISTDEFCGAGGNNFEGALALFIDKSELIAEDQTVNDATAGPVSLAGDPVTGLDPAINTGTSTGYFVNSVPFLANGNNNPVGDTLGLWTATNTADVTSDPTAITLTGTVLNSEPYAFPVPATSTGTGAVTTVDGLPITSEAALNPDDSRLSGPVSVTHNLFGGLTLWTALDATVTPASDTNARDGAAWFAINTSSQSISQQGYVTARGANLLYPAIGVANLGHPLMVFTVTSKTINPSAAYTVLGSHRIITVASGHAAHVSFSPVLFGQARWGDYSFAQVDPSGLGIWLATEYIPPAADQSPIDNWGTDVFEVDQF